MDVLVAIYEFLDEQGSPVELEFDMGKCPTKIGDTLQLDDGRRVTRVMSVNKSPGAIRCRDLQHEAFHLPSLRHGRDPDVPRYSKPGTPGMLGDFPLFANEREATEYEAKKAAKGSTMRFNQ
jgi:hypothetical protein